MSTAQDWGSELAFSVGNAALLQEACSARPLSIFAAPVLDFLGDLSQAIRALPDCTAYPDLVSFSFWCRRRNLAELAQRYDESAWGRGLALHITPGNVPLNFAYSLAIGLLAGNANAVRLPSTDFPQSRLLCQIISHLLTTRHGALAPYLICFRCEHDSAAISVLSARCGVRVLWGGDETILRLRALPIPPRAVELTFASRYSLAVLDADAYLQSSQREELARQFYTDAYWSDQLACTAPRAVLWLGQAHDAARADFWCRVSELAQAGSAQPAVTAVQKRQTALLLAARYPGVQLVLGDNSAVRVEVQALTPALLEDCTGGGFFLECVAADLSPLAALDARCQTLAVYGVSADSLRRFFAEYSPRGFDRVVSLGHTADFGPDWDGYDLIRSMSRKIVFSLS